MFRSALAGAAALVGGPLLGLIGVIVAPTMSDDSADVVAALTAHRSAMITGLTLQTLGVAVLIGGIVWLAITLAPSARRLALAGGILGVAGALVVLFEDGLSAATPSIVSALDSAQAATAVDHVHTSVGGSLEPVSVLLAIGIVLLGYAAVRANAARWLAPTLTVAALVQTVGFAAGSRPLVVVGFAGLVIGLALIIRSMQASAAPGELRKAVVTA